MAGQLAFDQSTSPVSSTFKTIQTVALSCTGQRLTSRSLAFQDIQASGTMPRMSPAAKAMIETMSAAGYTVGVGFDDDSNAVLTATHEDGHKHVVRAETVDDAVAELVESMGWEDTL